MKKSYREIAVFIILLALTGISLNNEWFPVLDGVNLIFHEAGHTILIWAGEFVHFLGGTLGQLFVPGFLALYFVVKRKWLAAILMLWWFGQNFIGISTYIGDARIQELELIGGNHDWAYLLGRMNLINKDLVIARVVRTIGAVIMVVATLAPLIPLYIKTSRIANASDS